MFDRWSNWRRPGTGERLGAMGATTAAVLRTGSGSAQLGIVPARAWDVLGPLTLRPLKPCSC